MRKPFVGGQGFEEVNCCLEVVDYLFLGRVVCVALRVQGADTCAVFLPFVVPKGLVVALVVFPVGVHVGEQIGLARSGYDGGDVGVGASRVAVGVVGAVAVIRPSMCQPWSKGVGCGCNYHKPWTVQLLLGPVEGL